MVRRRRRCNDTKPTLRARGTLIIVSPPLSAAGNVHTGKPLRLIHLIRTQSTDLHFPQFSRSLTIMKICQFATFRDGKFILLLKAKS